MITASDTFRPTSFVPTPAMRNHRCRQLSFQTCAFRSINQNHYDNVRNNCYSSSSLSASPVHPSSSLWISSSAELDTTMFLLPDSPFLSPFFIAILALVLLVSAQSFINAMLEGDQGLGAFLSDGSGYNRSGYRPNTRRDSNNLDDNNNDPLPWLKLPKLDFVDVAGQEAPSMEKLRREEQERVYEELNTLRRRLNRELETVQRKREERRGVAEEEDNDDMAEAKRLRSRLEGLMKTYGIEYETE